MSRKRRPLSLIYELDLISRDNPTISFRSAALDYADLSEITLRNDSLSGTDLRWANLRGADLSEAYLRGADLSRANLADACLKDANLLPYEEQDPARLNSFNLNGVDPDIDLSDENLKPTNLSGAILEGTDLSGANLAYANLYGAKGVTNEELERQANSLKGATMPNGQEYELWLKYGD
jgi:uncharacterized protein YjbI with pentapeptide repeats